MLWLFYAIAYNHGTINSQIELLIEINTTIVFDFRFLQLFLLIAIETNSCKIFAFFYISCNWQKNRFSSKCLRQIYRGVATPNIFQKFYLFRGCDNSIALELEQVSQHIFGRKKFKNYFRCKSNVIRTLHLFYRHNTTCKNVDTKTAIHTMALFFELKWTSQYI